ncbi:hypothetical protein [Teredinibacter haidensis]|uniref:hypothetical protein n=1 Tax=Teredinibacter haidensis TaxID=2731755 RepID=UPI00094891AA|nr:hypothetical protein [Teredinibacter haidensis]
MSSTLTDANGNTINLYRRLLSYAYNYKSFLIISIFGFVLFSGMDALLFKTPGFFVAAIEGNPVDLGRFNFISVDIRSSIYFVPITIIVLSAEFAK